MLQNTSGDGQQNDSGPRARRRNVGHYRRRQQPGDFEILGLNAQKLNNPTVFFEGLSITPEDPPGTDVGGLVLATGSGVGGGLLMDGSADWSRCSQVLVQGQFGGGSHRRYGFPGRFGHRGPWRTRLARRHRSGCAIYLARPVALTPDGRPDHGEHR